MRQQHYSAQPVPLPYIPQPQADELISSWIARIASQYNLSSSEFLRYIGWSGMDLDYDPTPSDLQKLANYTNYPVSHIRAMTLKTRFPKRQSSDFFTVSTASKHLPVYCAACFERDIKQGKQPYWRYHWASIWSSYCKIDGFLLLDNCETMACYLSGQDRLRLFPCHLCKARPLYPNGDAEQCHLSLSTAPEDNKMIIKPVCKNGWVLGEFEEAMGRALDGVPPGSQWWNGHSASAFRQVATDLVPFIIIKQEPYASPHLYPAKSLLRYNGVLIEVRKGEVIDYWTKAGLANVSEVWRHIALETLARIMIQPNQYCFLQFMPLLPGNFYYYNFHHDLFHVFLSTLSQTNLQRLAAIADQWPRRSRSRVQAYLADPRSYYLS